MIALETRHLTKRFGALTAVADLSLEIRAGEIFGFLAPNGAGKTSSIQMMCGFSSSCYKLRLHLISQGESHVP